MIRPFPDASRALKAARLHHRAGTKVELHALSSSLPKPRCSRPMCSFAATTSRDNLGRSHQFPRVLSSVADSLIFRSSRNLSNSEHHQTRSYGFSNFTNMLQYNDLCVKSPFGDSTRRRIDTDAAQRRKFDPYQRDDVASEGFIGAETKPHANMNSINDNAFRNKNHGRTVRHERHHWRSRKAPTVAVPKNAVSTYCKVPTSGWILISGTPPTSKLSDLFPCLDQIIGYELQKGIIDLDALQDPRNCDSLARANALNEVGALDTLYPKRRIDNRNSDIPLWSPYSSDPQSVNDAHPMILEARLQLSYRARPTGWFLKLPNRSVVHAVLNHVRCAKQNTRLSPNEDGYLKQQRKEWRQGLWEGVYADYERAAKKKEAQAVVLEREENSGEMLTWGESSLEGASEGGNEVTGTTQTEESKSDADSYIKRYSQSHPYPSTTQSARQPSPYQIMKSGSTMLSVREFSPYPTDISSFSDEYIPWDQHAFHLCPHLNLSDSVVRVETSDLATNEEDVQFFFRGYDLRSVPLEKTPSVSVLPSCFTDFPKSIGWNVRCNNNVDLLVEGIHSPKRNPLSNRGRGTTKRASRHTFLVRFASPAEARMAVRDTNGKFHDGHRWSVCQYPSSTLGNN